mmetsp:Transcript_66704/g.145458  ORF Transcript_66704/g.145458 Transcript_66704/m.145458 type:complete len:395 (+) Transcript_66704:170-1354(+)|eukprot:CAMPEP_0170608544 /NCGR_PEP_ID=MMETSP0224-20130122/21639_1 /TAXON_ID=285029 /ORGANISM="Togula jolla, Strain CCCM 725" /LENGTH=394 /DNA_ID=CAMNT_0010933773 /DNA_START=168 /DNA_END=1352 /DNA_ORIENTATION=-
MLVTSLLTVLLTPVVTAFAGLPVQATFLGVDKSSDQGMADSDAVALSQLDAALWAGEELVNVEPPVRGAVAKSSKAEKRHVQILGLQNTGTNLLAAMMHLNFDPHILYHDLSKGHGSSGPWRRGIWKHANLEVMSESSPTVLQEVQEEHAAALVMIRDPVSWLQSMHKAPYELSTCIAGSSWLSKKCVHAVPAGYGQEGKRLPGVHKLVLPNIEAVWNEWNAAYSNATSYGFAGGMVIRYEDLVLQPDETMQRIADFLKLPAPARVRPVLRSAKRHGQSVGHNEAIQKLTEKLYLKEYSPEELKVACSNLDEELMKKYSYNSCNATSLGRLANETAEGNDSTWREASSPIGRHINENRQGLADADAERTGTLTGRDSRAWSRAFFRFFARRARR